MRNPLEQDEQTTLQAQLREALQHQRAALERFREAREDLEQVLERARQMADLLPPEHGRGRDISH
jgi:hypothetical protein